MAAVLRTETGLVRSQNEDSAWFDDEHGIYAVADGMGGHLAGEVASAMAIDAVKQMVFSGRNPGILALRDMMHAANRDILTHSGKNDACSGMGTTLSVLWRREKRAYIAHVGDSRIYRLRGDSLVQVTRDHSLVEEMVEAGLISREEARNHPRRNIITRALGTEGDNYPDLLVEDILAGDCWLLCSDGLTGMLEDGEIQEVLSSGHDLGEKADTLMRMALRAGGRDNITLVLFSAEDEAWNQD